jgi:hypothetical protein
MKRYYEVNRCITYNKYMHVKCFEFCVQCCLSFMLFTNIFLFQTVQVLFLVTYLAYGLEAASGGSPINYINSSFNGGNSRCDK